MSLKEFLEYPILSIHTYTLHMYQVIGVAVVICVSYIVEKISKKIFLGFESAKKFFPQNSCEVVGQILDPKLFEKNPSQTIFWKTTKKHILVIC